MPELPKVSQEFTADVSGYLRGIEEMVKAAEHFIRENEKAIASVRALQAAIDDLDGKVIVITVKYVTEGNLPDVKEVTQVINQVYRGDDRPPPVTQGVEQIHSVMTDRPQEFFKGTETVRPMMTGHPQEAFRGVEYIRPVMTRPQEAFRGTEVIRPVLAGHPQEMFTGLETIKSVIPDHLGGLSRTELLKIAKEVNIAGRSTMTKQELVTSLTRTSVEESGIIRGIGDAGKTAAETSALKAQTAAVLHNSEALLAMARSENTLKSASDGKNISLTAQVQATNNDARAALNAAHAHGTAMTATGKTTSAVYANRDALALLIEWWHRWGNVIHFVVMLSMEFLAVFLPAMVAAAGAMAVAAQAAVNVANRVSSINVVAQAVGDSVNKTAGQMLGLGDALHRAQDAMQPAVYEAFGGALNALKGHFGGLWQMGTNVIQMFDTFVAKLDIELKSGLGKQLSGIFAAGAKDLQGFAQELGNIGKAILNFASAMPGLASVILGIFVALTHLLKIISELPQPILTAAFALEEFLRWGGLLVNVGARLVTAVAGLEVFGAAGKKIAESGVKARESAGSFGGLFKTIVTFAAENPLAAVGVAAALALGGFAYWARTAKSSTDQWVASVNKAVTGAPDFSQINTTVQALSGNTRHLADAQAFLNTKTSDWSRLASGAQQDFSALDNQHRQLTQDIFTESGNVSLIAHKYGVSIPTAIGLAQAAGVKLTDSMHGQSVEAQTNRQKIDNLITGYQAMGQRGNQLVSSINAVSIANSAQVTAVGKLNNAWKTIIDMGANVQTGFLTFQQGLKTISDDAKKAGASFNGLNTQSLQLRQDFQKNISNMSTSLQSMNTALSLGGVSWNDYRKYIATTVAEMLHAGNLSNAQKAQLGLVASAAGYTGSSYSSLASWVGKYAGSQNSANDIINTATIKLSNLSQMAERLQGTLQTDVIDTTSKMVLGQQGFQAELSKTYDDFKRGGTASKPFRDDLKTLDKILGDAGFSQQQVTQYNQFLVKQFKDTSGVQAANAGLKSNQGAMDANLTHARGFGSQVKDVMDAVGHSFLTAMDGMKHAGFVAWDAIVSSAKTAVNAVKGAWDASAGFIKGVWGGIESAAKTVWNTIYNDVIGPVKRIITDVKNFFVSSFDNWWKTHGDAIKQIWNSAWQGVVMIFHSFVDPIVSGVKALWSAISGVFTSSTGAVKTTVSTMWSYLVAIAKAFWAAIEPIISTGWTVIKDLFKITFNDIKASWQIFWDVLKAIGLTVFDGIRAGIKTVWDLIVGIFSIFIDLLTGHWHQAWVDMKTMGEQIWNAIKDFFGQAFGNFKGAFKDALNVIKGTWDKDWHEIKDVVTNVWHLIKTSADTFWQHIKNGFRDAVNNIKNKWNELKEDFRKPVAFLVNTVYEGGIRRFWNDIMGFIHGPKLPAEHFAMGGRVPGYGGGDQVPAMLEAGEAVVPKHLVSQLAPFLAMNNVPGFAQGGLVNPIGKGLRGERVDQGVDYGGYGPLYALGAGSITSVDNSGWPGGRFIDLRLNPPYGSGYWFYAEDISPAVHVGQAVSAGQLIGHAYGGSSGIEVGWASGRGGQTAAAAAGQQNKHGDPGEFPTAWGVAANNLIKSLGGPGGFVRGPVHGGTAGFGGFTSVFGTIIKGVFRAITGTIKGLGNAASVISAIATGNTTALSNAMSRLIGPGGAKGALAEMIVGVPKTLIKDTMGWFSNFVRGHTTTETSGGGLPHGPIGKNIAKEVQYAQDHLPGYGWGQGQMGPLISLWQKESGWNPFAINKASGAYGIPQALGHGHPYALGDYMAQIIWGLNYIKSTYGSPARAWSHEVAHNWYDQGGWLMPGVTMAVNNTGRPERVLGPGENGGTIEATFHVHTHLNGREIWHDMQKETFKYDMRNRGQVTGGLSNLDR